MNPSNLFFHCAREIFPDALNGVLWMNYKVVFLLFPLLTICGFGIFGEYLGLYFPVERIELALSLFPGQENSFSEIGQRLGSEDAERIIIIITNIILISVTLPIPFGVVSAAYCVRSKQKVVLSRIPRLLILSVAIFGFALLVYHLASTLNYSFLFNSLSQDFRYTGSMVSFCLLISLFLCFATQLASTIFSIAIFSFLLHCKDVLIGRWQ
jgi:hypothetical protein